MKLVFWQPFPSFHQEGFLTALAAHPSVESLSLRVESDLPASRKAMGWREAHLPGVQVEKISEGMVPESGHEYVHIFTGFGSHRVVWAAYRRLQSDAESRCYAYTEAPDFTGLAGGLRSLCYRFRARKLGGLEGILAIGEVGVSFYRELCRDQIPVHAFGYYDAREAELKYVSDLPEKMGEWRLLVAGQLIRRKGVDLLLRALAGLQDVPWQLHVAGDGPERKRLESLTRRLNLGDRVSWSGGMEREELQESYAKSDLVIVPSRFDGWGMVVNEALQSGCPVLATETCGSAGVLPQDWRMPPTVLGIRESLRKFLNEAEPDAAGRKAFELSRQTTGEAGVERLLRILRP
jgi:glycosyltransferase involved in cell wall biosynthesis